MSQIADVSNDGLNRLKEICRKATQVVGWYPHAYSDHRMPGCLGTVRGPFGRWFGVTGGDNGMGDPEKYPTPVASIEDDVNFCAAAMNNLPALLDLVQSLQKERDALRAEVAIARERLGPAGYKIIQEVAKLRSAQKESCEHKAIRKLEGYKTQCLECGWYKYDAPKEPRSDEGTEGMVSETPSAKREGCKHYSAFVKGKLTCWDCGADLDYSGQKSPPIASTECRVPTNSEQTSIRGGSPTCEHDWTSVIRIGGMTVTEGCMRCNAFQDCDPPKKYRPE